MSRKKRKKNKKPTIDYKTLAVSAIVDLLIGIILLIIEKLIS